MVVVSMDPYPIYGVSTLWGTIATLAQQCFETSFLG
jgi:hypothetical protein